MRRRFPDMRKRFNGLKNSVAFASYFSAVLALGALSADAIQSVTLAWNPSTNSDVAGYNVYYGVASGVYTNVISLGNVTEATIPGLIEGVTYYFAAKARSSSGVESDFSNEAFYTVPLPTNAPPTLNPINNIMLYVNSAKQQVRLSGIGAGAGNSTQNLKVSATCSSPLIASLAVSYASPNTFGYLTFTPAANAIGSATVAVTVSNGQTSNNTTTQFFTVTVTDVNHPPTLAPIGNVSIGENSGPQAVPLSGITSGASYESQPLTVTAISSNPGLIPNPVVNYISPFTTGALILTPATNAYGTGTITVTVNDGQTQNNTVTQSFTVTVAAVNQPPTLNPIPNLVIPENAGPQTIALSGISSGAANENQTLTVNATSSNPNVIPNPAVQYASANSTGTLTFTPVNNASGAAIITVTVNDGGLSNNIVARTFSVGVLNSLALNTALTPPLIVDQPTNLVAIAGQTVAFQVNALAVSGTPLIYQWQYNSVNLPSATNAVLTLTNVTADQAGLYSVNIANSSGFTNSSAARLTVFHSAAATLDSAAPLAKGRFAFIVNGVPGYRYVIQASTNMTDWVSLQTNTAPFNFVDANAGQFKQRFYRSVCLP